MQDFVSGRVSWPLRRACILPPDTSEPHTRHVLSEPILVNIARPDLSESGNAHDGSESKVAFPV